MRTQTWLPKYEDRSIASHMQPFFLLNLSFLVAYVDYKWMFAIVFEPVIEITQESAQWKLL